MTLSIKNKSWPAPIDPVDLDSLKPVATAIDFLVAAAEAGDQPGLEETARHCGLSQAHFQKLFRAGAGVSPKRFLQYLTAGRAISALAAGAPVLDAAFEAGLSAPSRLHDLMVHAEAMPPGSIRRRGAGETIRWARVPGPFGLTLIGVTTRGICWLSFETVDPGRGLREMNETWAAADFIEDETAVCGPAEQAFAFATGRSDLRPGLHVQGTNFQLKVWEALLRIPAGTCVAYGEVARALGAPKAARAVGSAVGANAISVLIPCHRVIRASGAIQQYRWGAERKNALLAMEAASLSPGMADAV